MKPENIYQIENNQQNQDTCLLFYYKSKSYVECNIHKIFNIFLRFFRYLLRLVNMYFLSVFFSDTEKPSCYSPKNTLVGTLHYREKGEQTDSTRDID